MLNLYVVKDSISQTTGVPMSFQTDRDARDGFQQAVNDPKTSIAKHPSDYALWKVGHYDERKMIFDPEAKPELIARAEELVIKQ